MANISQTQVSDPYTVTADDAANSTASIPILWKSAFNDTNYAIGWSFSSDPPPTSAVPLTFKAGIVNVTRNGFTAVINSPIEGQVIVIYAMASHK